MSNHSCVCWQWKPMASGRGRGGFSLVELLVASVLTLLVMAAVAALFGEFGRSVADGRALSELNSRTRNVAWRLRQDLAGITCVPSPLVPVEAGAGYLTANATSLTGPPFSAVTTDFLAMTTSNSGAPFRGRIKEVDPAPTYPGFEAARGFESPTAEVVWFVEPSVMFKNRQLYNLYRRQLLVAATPEAGVFRNNVFANPGLPGESDLSFGNFPVTGAQHANSLSDLSKPDRQLIARPRSQWRFSNPTVPVAGGPNRVGEDVILSNVLYFDVRTSWQSGNSTNTYPLALGNTTFQTLPTGDPAGAPLRSIAVTITCLEPTANQERVIEVVHSFGQERNQVAEP